MSVQTDQQLKLDYEYLEGEGHYTIFYTFEC